MTIIEIIMIVLAVSMAVLSGVALLSMCLCAYFYIGSSLGFSPPLEHGEGAMLVLWGMVFCLVAISGILASLTFMGLGPI